MVAGSNINLLPQKPVERIRKKSTLITTQYNDMMTLDSLATANGITPMTETRLEEGNVGQINEFRLGASPEKGTHALVN